MHPTTAWILIEIAALVLFGLALFTALRALRNTPPHSRLARGPRRAPISSELHRTAELADRAEVRLNVWRYRWWRLHGYWPTGRLPAALKRQAA